MKISRFKIKAKKKTAVKLVITQLKKGLKKLTDLS